MLTLLRQAEDAYAKAIQRALNSLQAGKTSFDMHHSPALGSSSVKALERVVEYESAELVRIHEQFARRCRDLLEVPLRSRASKDDWTAVQKHERNTEALMKEYEEAQHRYQKVGLPLFPIVGLLSQMCHSTRILTTHTINVTWSTGRHSPEGPQSSQKLY